MAYWLFKSEPETWSWRDQLAKGEKGQEWDGVRNFAARNFMRAMKKGERGFFYHSGAEKQIVGIVTISRSAHVDSTDPSGPWECVDIGAIRALPRPVGLAAIKGEKKLAEMVLVKNARLSVQPVSEAEWKIILALGGIAGEKGSAS